MKSTLAYLGLVSLFLTTSSLTAADTSLQERIKEFQMQNRATLDAQTMMFFDEKVANLRATGIINRALEEGDRAPHFRLPNAVGQYVSLDRLLNDGPVVLVFYRGGWCPYCNLQLEAYQEYLSQFRALGATLVAISPESPDDSLSTVEKHNLDYHVLSDNNNTVASQFNIVYEVSDDLLDVYKMNGIELVSTTDDRNAYELPLAAAYVIDEDRRITYSFVTADFRQRAEPADVVAALQELDNGQS